MTAYEYNPATGLFERYRNGYAYTDGNTGENLRLRERDRPAHGYLLGERQPVPPGHPAERSGRGRNLPKRQIHPREAGRAIAARPRT